MSSVENIVMSHATKSRPAVPVVSQPVAVAAPSPSIVPANDSTSYATNWWRARSHLGRCINWSDSATFVADIGPRMSERHRLVHQGEGSLLCGTCGECRSKRRKRNVIWSDCAPVAGEICVPGPDGTLMSLAAHGRRLGLTRAAASLRYQQGGVGAFTAEGEAKCRQGRPVGSGGCSVCKAQGESGVGHNAIGHAKWVARDQSTKNGMKK